MMEVPRMRKAMLERMAKGRTPNGKIPDAASKRFQMQGDGGFGSIHIYSISLYVVGIQYFCGFVLVLDSKKAIP